MFERETLAIIGEGDCDYERAVSPPIFQTSTFGGGHEFSYSRCSNPTRCALEKAVASLEGGRFGFAFSSGLAAINAVFSLSKKGDRVIVSDDLYGGTYRMIKEIYEKYGIEFIFADLTDLDEVETLFSEKVDMLFAETPTNPMMKIADISALSALCKDSGALFVVDNTFLSPYFQNPIALGADIVVHSATKYLSGHHDTVAGVAVTDREDIASHMSLFSMTLGNALSPFDCWRVLRGIRTLPMRMQKHESNAKSVAEFLKTLPEVEQVFYPALPEHKGHELCARQSRGFGGVVTFTVREKRHVESFIKGGDIIKFAESLGGFRTLVTYPLTQTHFSIPPEMREKIGITDRTLRLSLGLENENDIKKDIIKILRAED
jgi:cystathionine gamma-synthase